MASDSPSRAAAAGGVLRRLRRAWRALEREQRTAAFAALALFVTMFLPWYSRSAVGVVKGAPVKVDDTLTAFGSFSFVEAAVLLVAVGVLWMLFARGEGKAFHLPFGDGNVIFAAGLWVCLLVFYRQFDKPSATTTQGLATNIGVSWGIFVTFLVGLFLAFSGQRLRVAHLVEPPLPGDVASSDEPLPRGRRRPAEETAATRAAPSGRSAASEARPRPTPSASHTVVDRRGPGESETLITDVPEFPPRRGGPKPPDGGDADRPATPPTAPTRIVDAEELLRSDDAFPVTPATRRAPTPEPAPDPSEDATRRQDPPSSDPDGQLRFDG
jgi:hypothetical protein